MAKMENIDDVDEVVAEGMELVMDIIAKDKNDLAIATNGGIHTILLLEILKRLDRLVELAKKT